MTIQDKVNLCGVGALIALCIGLLFDGCSGLAKSTKPARRVVAPLVPQLPVLSALRRSLQAIVLPPQYHTNYVRLLFPPGAHPSNEVWAVQFSSDLKNWQNVGTNAYGTNAFGYVWWPMYATGRCGYARLKKL